MGRILLTEEQRRNWKNRYFKKSRIPNAVKVAVATRYGCRPGGVLRVKCAFCDGIGEIIWKSGVKGTPITEVRLIALEWDHFIPEFNGGETTEENLVLACRACNRARGHNGKYQPEVQF